MREVMRGWRAAERHLALLAAQDWRRTIASMQEEGPRKLDATCCYAARQARSFARRLASNQSLLDHFARDRIGNLVY